MAHVGAERFSVWVVIKDEQDMTIIEDNIRVKSEGYGYETDWEFDEARKIMKEIIEDAE